MTAIRVLVVDDSVVIRHLITEVFKNDEHIEVVGTARNGRLALEEIDRLEPDLVTLDIEMPEMNGLETLVEIRKTRPRLPVIMFSTLTQAGAAATMEALTSGASDYVTKPSNVGSMTDGLIAVRDELVPKVYSLCGRPLAVAPEAAPEIAAPSPDSPVKSSNPASMPTPGAPRRTPPARRSAPPQLSQTVSLLVIGCSTGGPAALAEIWPALDSNFPVPVLLVQHMPPVFTGLLAGRLTKASTVPMAEGTHGEPLVTGEARIAPGDQHMDLVRDGLEVSIRLHLGPPENSCRPSVEPLFRSAAALFGSGVLAVMLTGMGNDGIDGCRHIAAAGGQILAQDEASSVVWGMPGAIVSAGLANDQLPLDQIAHEINRRVQYNRPKPPLGAILPPQNPQVRHVHH